MPTGADRLNAAIAYKSQHDEAARITLVNPDGDFANYSVPQGPSDYGQVDVGSPMPGRWTAYIWAHKPFDRTVSYQFYSSHYVSGGTVTPPSATLQPGASSPFSIELSTPSAPGDTTSAVQWTSGGNFTTSTPIVLRSLVPLGPGATGAFNGLITGGNGRGGAPGQSNVFSFDIPVNTRAVSVAMRLLGNHDVEVDGFLVSPGGQALSVESNVSDLVGEDPVAGPALQLNYANPAPGRWTFVSILSTPVAGTETSQQFQGHVVLDNVPVSAPGLPNSPAVTLSAAHPKTVNVTVKNNGVAAEGVFFDARFNTARDLTLAVADGNKVKLPFPFLANTPSFTVTPETQSVTVTATANIPIAFDYFPLTPFLGPDVSSAPVGRTSASGTEAASELPSGKWDVLPSSVGPFTSKGPAHGIAKFTASARMLPFDPTVTSRLGDFWLSSVDPTSSSSPAVVEPGHTTTIPVTIKARGTSGTVVRGTLFVDSLGWLGSGDELAALPYSYTVK